VVRQICRLCHETAEQNNIGFDKIQLAVIGVPGVPDQKTGKVLLAPNIPEFDTFDVAAAIKSALNREVILENDVNLAGLGEHWIGAGAGIDDLAYIALGTGIGSGILVGGELIHGHTSAAGELGYLPFGAAPFDAESLRAGAMERVVATNGIRTRYHALSGNQLDVPQIFDAAELGDTDARTVIEETARYLARTVAAICAITNPGKVILGGSIGSRPELIKRVHELMPLCFPYPVEIAASALGSHAALAGGAAVGLTNLHATLFSGGVQGAEISLPPANSVTFLRAAQ
jgi:predicted NBD/HSP70 family sugar kinase